MPLYRALKLLDVARKESVKEELYKLYVSIYPHFTKESFQTFNEFYEERKPAEITELDTRLKDEIMQELLKIDISQKKGG